MTAATLPRHRHRKPRLHKRLLARLRWLGLAVWRAPRRAAHWAWNRQATPYVLDTPQDRKRVSRRQRRQVEGARADAYVVRIEAHAPPPLTRAHAALAARIAAYSEALDGLPPAAVLPDEPDERWPHLAPAYDDDTKAFGLSITEAGDG